MKNDQIRGTTYLLLGKSRSDANDVDNITLDDPDIGEMAPTMGLKFLALTFTLLLLLSEAFVAVGNIRQNFC